MRCVGSGEGAGRGGCSTGKADRAVIGWRGRRRGEKGQGEEMVMAQQKRGLGKGLGALIPMAPSPLARADASDGGTGSGAPGRAHADGGAGPQGTEGTYLEEVAIGSITPNPRQPRQGDRKSTRLNSSHV